MKIVFVLLSFLFFPIFSFSQNAIIILKSISSDVGLIGIILGGFIYAARKFYKNYEK